MDSLSCRECGQTWHVRRADFVPSWIAHQRVVHEREITGKSGVSAIIEHADNALHASLLILPGRLVATV